MPEVAVFDMVASIKAQKEYCERTGSPHFAPSSGRCYYCKANIYRRIEHDVDPGEEPYATGVSVAKASTQLVTGCPHCSYSYCE